MTKPLETQFAVGDEVALIDDTETSENNISRAVRRLRVGAVGTIRKIIISDPNDGDDTFLMFYVRFARVTTLLGAAEIGPGRGGQGVHVGAPAARRPWGVEVIAAE